MLVTVHKNEAFTIDWYYEKPLCYPISPPFPSYFFLLSVKIFSRELELRKLYVLRSARLSKSAAGCDRLDRLSKCSAFFNDRHRACTHLDLFANLMDTKYSCFWCTNAHNPGNLQTYIHFGKSTALNEQCFRIAKCRTHQYLVSRCVLSRFSSKVQFAAIHSFACER